MSTVYFITVVRTKSKFTFSKDMRSLFFSVKHNHNENNFYNNHER